jgi:Skp family chaperone for outer membrane proteins
MTTKQLDRPPILKFLALFVALLVVALGLAALPQAAGPAGAIGSANGGVIAAEVRAQPH